MKKLLIAIFAFGSIFPSFAKVVTPRDQVDLEDGYNHFVHVQINVPECHYDRYFHVRYLEPNLYEAWTLVPSFRNVDNGSLNDDDFHSDAKSFFSEPSVEKCCTINSCKVVRVKDPVTGKTRLHLTVYVSTLANMYDVVDSYSHPAYPVNTTISEAEL